MQFELSTFRDKKFSSLGEAFVAAKSVNMREGREVLVINQNGYTVITFPGIK